MQPPGGGQPPSERKGKLPPPFGSPARPAPGQTAPPPQQPAAPQPPAPQQPYPPQQPQPYAQPPQPQPYPPQPQPYPPQPQPYPPQQPPQQPYAQPPQQPYAQPPQPQPYPWQQPGQAPQAAPPPAAQPAKLPPAPQPGSPPQAAPPKDGGYWPAPQPGAPPQAAPSPQGPPPSQGRLPLPPPGSAPPGPPPANPSTQDIVQSLRPAHNFVEFLQISLKRAFRLRIEHDQVTPHERRELADAGITDPALQSFLAWRRSVLFAFATLLVPLIVLKAVEAFSKTDLGDFEPILGQAMDTLQGLHIAELLVEVAFCALCWVQMRNWTNWRKQRRILAIGWLAFFLAPFLIYLYPVRSAVSMPEGANDAQAKALGIFFGTMFSVQAMLMLAPKAVSLIAGMVRASIVTKLLFPGTAGPGWLIVLAAPIYALFIYIVMIVPYQVTGSGFFVLAILGIITAEYFLGRGGISLARPMTRPDAVKAVQKVRQGYFIALGIGALFIVIALAELVDQLDFKPLAVVNLVGTFLTNVWILTLITTDVLIANLDRARGVTAGTTALAEESNRQIAAFVSADLPPGPPPPA